MACRRFQSSRCRGLMRAASRVPARVRRPHLAAITCCLVALTVAACAQAPPPEPAGTASPGQPATPRPDSTTRLTRSDGPYKAEVVIQRSGELLGLSITAADASAAPLPMTKRLQLWRPLVEQALRDGGRRDEIRLTLGDYPELRPRVALAAACSGKWDPDTGKPTSGRVNTAFLALMADNSLYAELTQFASDLGYRASVASAEEPLLCSWESVQPVATDRCRPALDASASVPCEASIVFQLHRLN